MSDGASIELTDNITPTLQLYLAATKKDMRDIVNDFLRDVAYRIHASFSITNAAGTGDNEGKFAEMFVRRARNGQCFNQPYLGCREFACDFHYVDSPTLADVPPSRDLGFGEPRDLGFMLYDLDFADPRDPQPRFFRAALREGSLQVPPWDSPEVLG